MSLLHRGRTTSARATILSVHDWRVNIAGDPYSSGGRTPPGERIRVRVKPELGAEFESEARVKSGSGFALENHDTYVLYDPDSPDHCDIDYDRLFEEFGETDRTCFPEANGAAAPAPPADNTDDDDTDDDLAGELARLGALHAAGTLTDAEFAAAKQRAIDNG